VFPPARGVPPLLLRLQGVMAGSVATAEIGGYAESIGILLLIAVISVAMHFRKASAATGEE